LFHSVAYLRVAVHRDIHTDIHTLSVTDGGRSDDDGGRRSIVALNSDNQGQIGPLDLWIGRYWPRLFMITLQAPDLHRRLFSQVRAVLTAPGRGEVVSVPSTTGTFDLHHDDYPKKPAGRSADACTRTR
jgi:hypothetical protein